MNLSQTRVLSAQVDFLSQKFRVPMRLSSGLIETITEARATVRVRAGDVEGEGRGSIYLSDLWSWPDPSRTHEQRDAILRDLCTSIAKNLPDLTGSPAHPLELGLRLHHTVGPEKDDIPALARAMCSSPFDAAIHDAVGYTTGLSAFRFYDEPVAIPSADAHFEDGACAAIKSLLQPPAEALEGCLIVNAHDDLGEPFAQELRRFGYRRLKVKLLGRSKEDDARLTAAAYRAARQHGLPAVRLSIDSNEGHASAEAVLDYLVELEKIDPDAYAALDYLEQPTSRDIITKAFDWTAVSARKPVMIDEGLTSLERLPLAIDQGWSGLALKTCKGHSFILMVAAWAKRRGLQLSMQDLTNPGLAAIHAYLLAARLPLLGGIELNSPQFTPQANESWLPRLASLFTVRDGLHRLPANVPGLGSNL
jgi:L-alanine-DL-glutamate epimerase-like enolase superfamily enzyme